MSFFIYKNVLPILLKFVCSNIKKYINKCDIFKVILTHWQTPVFVSWHNKFGPDRFSRFDFCWKQTYRQNTNFLEYRDKINVMSYLLLFVFKIYQYVRKIYQTARKIYQNVRTLEMFSICSTNNWLSLSVYTLHYEVLYVKQ